MKVCFVGVGSIGKRHIRNWSSVCRTRSLQTEIHVYRSTNRKLEKETQDIIDRETDDFDELDRWYDAVFITNPTVMHYETILSFLPKTNVFFVEKPIFESSRLDETKLCTDEKKYYIACPLRYSRVICAARELVQTEKIISARAISSSYLPDWRPGIDYRENYSARKELGGGVAIDLIHEWDYIISLFGYPLETLGMQGKFSDLEINSEDVAVYIARYEDKIVEIHLDYIGRVSRRNLELRTNENEYIFDILNGKVNKNGKTIQAFEEAPNDKYMREMEAFLEMVRGDRESENSLPQAIKTLQIAENTR